MSFCGHMNTNDFVFLGLHNSVTALRKDNGQIVWSTKLPGAWEFVTLTGEGGRIYAASGGRMHCLDLASGRILWTNGLKGYGYKVASIWLPGVGTAPTSAAYEQMRSEQDSSGAGADASGS